MASGGLAQAMSVHGACGVAPRDWRLPAAALKNSSSSSPCRCTWPRVPGSRFALPVRAMESAEDCNQEECAPPKEVGKISGEWLAEEKTKVVGTYPPLARSTRAWTGYVEKDTAGQTNIYSVEPTVYVAESAYSSGTAGSSAEGSENNLAISAGLGLIAVASASSILIAVGKNSPMDIQTTAYSGPPLSYYIQKFSPPGTLEASLPSATEQSVVAASFNNTESRNSTVGTEIVDLQVPNALDSAAPSSDVLESIPSEIPVPNAETD